MESILVDGNINIDYITVLEKTTIYISEYNCKGICQDTQLVRDSMCDDIIDARTTSFRKALIKQRRRIRRVRYDKVVNFRVDVIC